MISDDESSEKFVLRTLVAGFAAGTIQDIALYPLDSIKSRLQNEVGFWKSGGFRGIYKGISLAVCASGPAGALFFGTYEASKSFLRSKTGRDDSIGITIVSATFSEIVACLIRVPIENAKTRRLGLCRTCDQYKDYIFQCQVQKDGLRRSLYRGFSTRIVSYLPFAFIQVPLWDYFRLHICDRNYEYSLATLIPIKLALCGALSSAVTAIITTPLDVAVNRAMQCPMKAGKRQLVFSILKDLYLNRGFRRLFAGCAPRVIWTTVGSALFFGTYEFALRVLVNVAVEKTDEVKDEATDDETDEIHEYVGDNQAHLYI